MTVAAPQEPSLAAPIQPENYIRLAYRFARRFERWGALHGFDLEDLASEAMVAVVRAVRNYDPARHNCAFMPFVWGYIRTRFAHLVQKQKRRLILQSLPTDPDGEQIDAPDHRHRAEPMVREDTTRLLKLLDERTRLAVELWYGLDGQGRRSLGKIGAAIGGVSRERARQIIARGLKKMRAHVAEERALAASA
jgi:RNA polymerase sigma factor (sigma-70 family)